MFHGQHLERTFATTHLFPRLSIALFLFLTDPPGHRVSALRLCRRRRFVCSGRGTVCVTLCGFGGVIWSALRCDMTRATRFGSIHCACKTKTDEFSYSSCGKGTRPDCIIFSFSSLFLSSPFLFVSPIQQGHTVATVPNQSHAVETRSLVRCCMNSTLAHICIAEHCLSA
jgi:hypothetical protein